MELREHAIAGAEFLVVDTETNGLGGDRCELTEIGAVLVGGGELHDRWESVLRCLAPLRRGIQRFTGITQAMVDAAPPPEAVLPRLERELHGRVMVAHNASFDRRVLTQAFERAGLEWPRPPVICTTALARALLPLQREKALKPLAEALGIEVAVSHRALPDAETCARVLCALFPRLCANATTIADAVKLLSPRRRRPPRERPRAHLALPELDFGELPRDPGVYLFRDGDGAILYVGKSVSIASRARAHFAPASPPAGDGDTRADWRAHARGVDYRSTCSELGALVLENRLIKELRPPGNRRLVRRDDRLVYIRCRLDIPFPILEVAGEPAPGHAVSIGPLRGRTLALELVEQLDSLFGLRHCGRKLQLRPYPSAYGQMGRCLSPCLGDLDPNLYRRRLDEALRMFIEHGDARERLLAHVELQMREAARSFRYERAQWLRRRSHRLRTIFERLGGVVAAMHARPRVVLVRHPIESRVDAFWIIGGRLVDWGGVDDADALRRRTREALRTGLYARELGAHVPPSEVDEVRIVATWLAAHPQVPQLALDPEPTPGRLADLLAVAQAHPPERWRPQANGSSARWPPQANGSPTTSLVTPGSPTVTLVPGGASRRTRASPIGPKRGELATLETRPTPRPSSTI